MQHSLLVQWLRGNAFSTKKKKAKAAVVQTCVRKFLSNVLSKLYLRCFADRAIGLTLCESRRTQVQNNNKSECWKRKGKNDMRENELVINMAPTRWQRQHQLLPLHGILTALLPKDRGKEKGEKKKKISELVTDRHAHEATLSCCACFCLHSPPPLLLFTCIGQ